MASVSISGWSGAGDRTLTLTVVEQSYDVSKNTSIVKWTAEVSKGSVNYYDTKLQCVVNGTTVYNQTKSWGSESFPAAKGSTSGTLTINHDSDGSKSISFSITGYVYSYSDKTNSGSLTLTNIDRVAPTITSASVSSVGVSSFKISATANATCPQWSYRYKTSSSSTWGSWKYISTSGTSCSFTLSGLSSNTTYNVELSAQKGSNSLWSSYYSLTQKTLGASTITSAANITLGNAVNIKWTPLNSTYKFTLQFKYGSYSTTTSYISPGSTSVYTYTGTTIPVSVASQIPNGTSANMTVTLTTYTSSGISLGTSSKTFAISVPSTVVPVISESTVSIREGTPASGFGTFVKSLSKVYATFTATGASGSTISTVQMTVLGKTYTGSKISGNNYGITSDVLTSYGSSVPVTIKATDSRGRTATYTQNIRVIDYYIPTGAIASLTAIGDTLQIIVTGGAAPVTIDGTVRNSITLTITRVKISDPSDIETVTFTYPNSDNPDITSFRQVWNQTRTDALTESFQYYVSIKDVKGNGPDLEQVTAIVTISRLRKGTGVTFFQEAEYDGFWIRNVNYDLTSSEFLNLARNLSRSYDSTATYTKGDFCIYNDVVYVANQSITAPEAFNTSHWDILDSDGNVDLDLGGGYTIDDLSSLSRRLTLAENKIVENTGDISDLDERVGALEEIQNPEGAGKISDLETRVGAAEVLITSLDSQIDYINDTELVQIKNDITSNSSDISDLDDRVSVLEEITTPGGGSGVITNLQERLAVAESTIETHSSDIQDIDIELIDLDDRVSVLEEIATPGGGSGVIADLQNRMDTVESNISDISSNVANNTSDISTLTTKTNTNTSNISALTTKTNTNTTNISSLTTKTTTNTNNISALTTRVSTAESLPRNYANFTYTNDYGTVTFRHYYSGLIVCTISCPDAPAAQTDLFTIADRFMARNAFYLSGTDANSKARAFGITTSNNAPIIRAYTGDTKGLYATITYQSREAMTIGGSVRYPKYYDTQVNNVINYVNGLDDNWISFAVITDTHTGAAGTTSLYNSIWSPSIVNTLLSKSSKIERCFWLGDVEVGLNDMNQFSTFYSGGGLSATATKNKLYFAMGNHERTTTGSVSSNEFAETIYNALAADKTVQGGNLRQFYYYINDTSKKVRYMVINTCNSLTTYKQMTSAELTWINNAVTLPSSDWTLCVFGHLDIPTDSIRSGSSENGDALKAAFKKCNGHFAGYFCGHQHVDLTEKIDNSFQQTMLLCDAFEKTRYYNNSKYPFATRTYNTVTENAVTVVCINLSTKKVIFKRIGATTPGMTDATGTMTTGYTYS